MNTTTLSSRRAFLGRMSAAAASLALLPRSFAAGQPNSVFHGVRIGCITYSYRSMANTAEETLKALLDDGISEVELMGGPIQSFAGCRPGCVRTGAGVVHLGVRGCAEGRRA